MQRRNFLPILSVIFFAFPSSKTNAEEQSWFEQIRSKINAGYQGLKSGYCPTPPVLTNKTEVPVRRFEKSETELHDYFACYLPAEKQDLLKDYHTKYKPLIHAAANSFGISEVMLTCLLFRESQFDLNAVSHTGAIGLAQMVTDNRDYIHSIINKNDLLQQKPSEAGKYPNRYAELKAIVDAGTPAAVKFPKKLAKPTKEYLEAVRRAEKSKEALKSYAFAKTQLKLHELKKLHLGYYANLNKAALMPTQFTDVEARTPLHAIGAAALYLREIKDEFRDMLPLINEQNTKSSAQLKQQDWEIDLAAAGAYNLGHNKAIALAKLKSSTEGNSTKAWLEAVRKSRSETEGHIQSIRNCAVSNEVAAGDAYQPPNGTPWKDCFKPISKSAPVVTPSLKDVAAKETLPIAATESKPLAKKAKKKKRKKDQK